MERPPPSGATVARALALLRRSATAAKCHPCGCARHSVEAIQVEPATDDAGLVAAVGALRTSLVAEQYGCLGCRVCWPAEALALLEAGVSGGPACRPDDRAAGRSVRWPPLPGDYTVLRAEAPVAVCTLGDQALLHAVAGSAHPDVAIVGSLATENHGIERLVRNAVANPALRFLIVAGAERRTPVGHLPGASLLALAGNGIDAAGRIVGAPGRRAVLRNVAAEEVGAFRARIEVVDLIGESDPMAIIAEAGALARRPVRPRGAAPPGTGGVHPDEGYLPGRTTLDPAGYFVVYVDTIRRMLRLEHYDAGGVLDRVIEGPTAAHCYTPAIDAGLVTRLDHAAYLGRELARAESALAREEVFVQDAAPETAAPGEGACACDAPAAAAGCGPGCAG